MEEMLLIKSKVLPEVFHKVLMAKTLLATGKVRSASEAARIAGISRSAFYKYKDAVFTAPQLSGQILTVSVTLKDEPGQLNGLIGAFPKFGANILTVNQNIPSDHVALITVSARLGAQTESTRDILSFIKTLPGVIEVREIS